MPGFEPGAYRMRSERDTTTPHPRDNSLAMQITLKGIQPSFDKTRVLIAVFYLHFDFFK